MIQFHCSQSFRKFQYDNDDDDDDDDKDNSRILWLREFFSSLLLALCMHLLVQYILNGKTVLVFIHVMYLALYILRESQAIKES